MYVINYKVTYLVILLNIWFYEYYLLDIKIEILIIYYFISLLCLTMDWDSDKKGFIVNIIGIIDTDYLLLNTTSNYEKIVLCYKIANTLFNDEKTFRSNLSRIGKYYRIGLNILNSNPNLIPNQKNILQDYLLFESDFTYYQPSGVDLSWKSFYSAYLLNPKRLIDTHSDLFCLVNQCFIKGYYDIPHFIFSNGYLDINTNEQEYYTPFLLRAVEGQYNERIKFLLDNGADITIVDKYDKNKDSPLSIQIRKYFDNSEGGMDYDFDESEVIETTNLLLSKSIPNELVRKQFLEEILSVYEKYSDIGAYELIDTEWKDLFARYTDDNAEEIIDDYKFN